MPRITIKQLQARIIKLDDEIGVQKARVQAQATIAREENAKRMDIKKHRDQLIEQVKTGQKLISGALEQISDAKSAYDVLAEKIVLAYGQVGLGTVRASEPKEEPQSNDRFGSSSGYVPTLEEQMREFASMSTDREKPSGKTHTW